MVNSIPCLWERAQTGAVGEEREGLFTLNFVDFSECNTTHMLKISLMIKLDCPLAWPKTIPMAQNLRSAK